MDNDTKLSKEQIKNLLSDFKNASNTDSVNTNEFLSKHLNEKQAESIKAVLSDRKLMEKILSSKKAQDILAQLKGENTDES